jgi:hypothetical protein
MKNYVYALMACICFLMQMNELKAQKIQITLKEYSATPSGILPEGVKRGQEFTKTYEEGEITISDFKEDPEMLDIIREKVVVLSCNEFSLWFQPKVGKYRYKSNLLYDENTNPDKYSQAAYSYVTSYNSEELQGNKTVKSICEQNGLPTETFLEITKVSNKKISGTFVVVLFNGDCSAFDAACCVVAKGTFTDLKLP